jgi:hypothetical protein
MTDTPASTTTIIYANRPKSIVAAFFLTLLFGPLGLLYASIAGGIIMTILSIILVPLTAGIAGLIIWPITIVWAVIAAAASKKKPV